MQGVVHHVGVEVTGAARADLYCRYTLAADALGIVFRFEIALDHGDAQAPVEKAQEHLLGDVVRFVVGAQDAARVRVPCGRLSRCLCERGIRRVDFLKVDIEGAEYEMLIEDEPLWDTEIRALVVEVDRGDDSHLRIDDVDRI